MSAFGGLSGSMEHHLEEARRLRLLAQERSEAALAMPVGGATKQRDLGRLIRAATKATMFYGMAAAHALEAGNEGLADAMQRDANGLWSEVIDGYITMKER